MSAHNLVFGAPYLDIGDKAHITRIRDANGKTESALQFIVEFFRRGWFKQEENIYRCRGEIYLNGEPQNIVVEGRWNNQLVMKEKGVQTAVVWKANKMPEQYRQNYFMGHFTLQLNYLTEELNAKLPPTDSRRRPD